MDWIKCEEQLPEANTAVVVCDEYGDIDLAWLDNEGWWYVYGYAEGVKYWYPIPDLPQI